MTASEQPEKLWGKRQHGTPVAVVTFFLLRNRDVMDVSAGGEMTAGRGPGWMVLCSVFCGVAGWVVIGSGDGFVAAMLLFVAAFGLSVGGGAWGVLRNETAGWLAIIGPFTGGLASAAAAIWLLAEPFAVPVRVASPPNVSASLSAVASSGWRGRFPSDEERYGITSGQVEWLLTRPVCDICGRGWEKTARQKGSRPQQIDHCHTCNKVRGVLCFACNYHVVGTLEKGNYVHGKKRYLGARQYVLKGGAVKGEGLGCVCDKTVLAERITHKTAKQQTPKQQTANTQTANTQTADDR